MRHNRREVYKDDDNGQGEISKELLTSEHIPFVLVLMNAIEDTRRAIAHGDDGGLSCLLSLWAVLPAHIRDKFGELPAEIAYQSRVQYHWSNRYRKHPVQMNAVTHKEFNPQTAKFDEVVDHEARTIQVPVIASRKVEVQELVPKQYRRQFVLEKLTQIIDILDEEGLLWKSRLELVGGEREVSSSC